MSPEQLDTLYRIPLERKAEFLKRSVLLGRIFCSFFEESQIELAEQALALISQNSFETGTHPIDLFKEALVGTYRLPPFIEENLPIWEESLKYLVYGNSELENRIAQEKVNSAQLWADNKMKEILEELLEEHVYQFPSLEA